MKSKILFSPIPYLALFFVSLIWGATPVVAKLALQEIPFVTLAFLRFFLAFLLILPFLLVSKQKITVAQSDLPKIVLLGLLIVSFHIFFFFAGLKKTSAIDASVLSLIVPILSVVAGWALLKEKIYGINLIGIMMGLLGALIIIGIPLLFVGSLTANVLIGNSLIILSSISFVGGAILSRYLLKRYSPIMIVTSSFLVGALSFLPIAMLEFIQNSSWIYQISLIGIFGVVYLTLFSSISAYFLYTWAINQVGIVKADLIQYIQPVVAASLAVPILGERISYSFIIGTCLIVLGVYWGTLGRSEHHHHHIRAHRV